MRTAINVSASCRVTGSVLGSVAYGSIKPSLGSCWKRSRTARSRRRSSLKRFAHAQEDIQQALFRELEESLYEASLASLRYVAVDPANRLEARELDSRLNAALERVAQLQ